MVARDPYEVLGIEPGASATTVKAAWRRLARAHHPDLAADAVTQRNATRRMVEINAAYAALRQAPRSGPARARPQTSPPDEGATPRDQARPGSREERPTGPPPPPPTRPVTARLDTTELFRPRNATTTPHGEGYRHRPRGHVPRPAPREAAEPPRASTPTGPPRPAGRRRTRQARPTLDAARALAITFGKFHGLTLAEIAMREPTYLEWLARTITRDPDLVAAVRVMLLDLGIEMEEVSGERQGAFTPGTPDPAVGPPRQPEAAAREA